MLFLFENTLTHYIYIAPNKHLSHHTTTDRHTYSPLQAVEMVAPSHHEKRTTPPPTATPLHRFKPGRWAHHQTMSSAPHHHRPTHLSTSSSRGDGRTINQPGFRIYLLSLG